MSIPGVRLTAPERPTIGQIVRGGRSYSWQKSCDHGRGRRAAKAKE